MLNIKLERESNTSLFMQICLQIKYFIDNNILKANDKLPSTRKLASFLNVNRTTVYKAYEELWALGYIESKPGGYATVRKRFRQENNSQKESARKIDWTQKWGEYAGRIQSPEKKKTEFRKKKELIDFTPLSPDPDYLPQETFRKIVNNILRSSEHSLLNYGDPWGNESLREVIATQMQLHAITASTDNIIITNGAQNAIELIIKLITNKGASIIIENPTYSAILPLFKFYGLHIIPVPVNDEGIDLRELERKIKIHSPRFIYTMPNFQNPTGITTSQSHREKLLQIAERYEVPIIEDGFIEEMKYFGKNILPVKSMDKKGLVFYVGTFSKVLFPGLRIGWIVAEKQCIDQLAAIKQVSEISGNNFTQAALAQFCKSGFYEKQLKMIHKIYRKRMYTALKILRENLTNNKVRYSKPIGGYTIWFELINLQIQEDEFIGLLQQNGVAVTPGSLSYEKDAPDIYFRISIAHRNEDEIQQGLLKIINILNHLK
ncbi:MAG: PLP-dependent aminotransferase family protein [Bacteroidales bacterium]|jgi:GntR family transcriptional regulator/MocR family aminotransferase|nr:PLP-dependent aminotransferase family protein [Bacteroidales bacterium]